MSLPKRHFTSTVVTVAGCNAVTFRAWRNRNGLFPETRDATGWNAFSDADIAVVRIAVVLTDLGFDASSAVWAAMECLPAIESLHDLLGRGERALQFSKGNIRTIAVISVGAGEMGGQVVLIAPDRFVGRTIAERAPFGVAAMIDLVEIMSYVHASLLSGDYRVLATPADVLKKNAVSIKKLIGTAGIRKSRKKEPKMNLQIVRLRGIVNTNNREQRRRLLPRNRAKPSQHDITRAIKGAAAAGVAIRYGSGRQEYDCPCRAQRGDQRPRHEFDERTNSLVR